MTFFLSIRVALGVYHFLFSLRLDFPRDRSGAIADDLSYIFEHIAATALAMHFRASFGFAAAFQSPRIPAFMDARCERKLEGRFGEKMPPPRNPRSTCRREETKVKTAVAVSNQVLLRPQTEMLHCEGSFSTVAHWVLYHMLRW